MKKDERIESEMLAYMKERDNLRAKSALLNSKIQIDFRLNLQRSEKPLENTPRKGIFLN